MRKMIISAGLLVPCVFFILNYIILGVDFNFIEFAMLIIISVITAYEYQNTNDYLNPLVYFPVLYFALYWIGDFDFMIYPNVPSSLWIYYLVGLLGFYVGVFFIKRVAVKAPVFDSNDYLRDDVRSMFYFIYLVCIVCKLLMFIKSGVPLLASNIDASRQAAAESFGLLKVISSAHTILVVYFFYDIVSRKKQKLNVPKLNYFIIICSFAIAILDVSRLLIIQMIVPIVFIIILKVRRLKLKNIIIIFFLALVFIGANKFIRNMLDNADYFSYVMTSRGNSLFSNVMLSGFNSFRVGIDDFRQLVEVVPNNSPHTYGQMFINSIISPLPGKQVVIGYYVADILGMSFDGMGAATTILGMFYLDGGIVFVFFGMLIFGAFIYLNYKKHINGQNVSIYSLVSVYIVYYSINCLRTNVMPTIEPILFMFYYFVFSYIARKVSVKF